MVRNRDSVSSKLAVIVSFPKLFRNIHSLELPGYELSYPDDKTFKGLFDQIFIWQEYAFETDSETPLIIDCGSNIGLSIIFFKREYPRSRIIGFEPDAESFGFLKDNIERNNLSNIEIHNSAVYDVAGMIDFYSDLDRKSFVGMSVTKRLTEKNLRLKVTKVPSVLLSEYFSQPVDLLKMDIEGAELKVIRELHDKQKLCFVKQMFIEYHYNTTNPDNSLGELLGIMELEDFQYIIHSAYKPPYYKYQKKAYSFMIYAYR
jgi:FkbM family methyltransferase